MPPIKYIDSDNVDCGVDHLDATFPLLPALSYLSAFRVENQLPSLSCLIR